MNKYVLVQMMHNKDSGGDVVGVITRGSYGRKTVGDVFEMDSRDQLGQPWMYRIVAEGEAPDGSRENEMKVECVYVEEWRWVEWAYSRTTPDLHAVTIRNRARAYLSQHSPIRERHFRFECVWPDKVHTHLARHDIGGVHYVSTNRPDRGGILGPVRNHALSVNAQWLINVSHWRLCNMPWHETHGAFALVREAVREEDPALARVMVPNCIYQGGCPEPRGCGKYPEMIQLYADYPLKRRADTVEYEGRYHTAGGIMTANVRAEYVIEPSEPGERGDA